MFLNDIVTPMTAEEIKKTPVKSTVKEDSPWGSGEGYTGDLWHGTGDAWSGEGGAGGMPTGIGESVAGTMTFKEWAEAQGDLYKNFSNDSQTYARAKRAYLEAKQTTAETVSSFSNPADTESPIHGEDATSQFVQGPGVDDSQSPIHSTGNVQEDEDAKDLYKTTNDASTKDVINRGGRIIGHGKSTNAKLAAALSRSLDDLEQEKEKNQDQEKAIQNLDTVVAKLGKDSGLDTAPIDTGKTTSALAPTPTTTGSVARPGMTASNTPTMPTPSAPTMPAPVASPTASTNVISMPSMPATSKSATNIAAKAKQPVATMPTKTSTPPAVQPAATNEPSTSPAFAQMAKTLGTPTDTSAADDESPYKGKGLAPSTAGILGIGGSPIAGLQNQPEPDTTADQVTDQPDVSPGEVFPSNVFNLPTNTNDVSLTHPSIKKKRKAAESVTEEETTSPAIASMVNTLAPQAGAQRQFPAQTAIEQTIERNAQSWANSYKQVGKPAKLSFGPAHVTLPPDEIQSMHQYIMTHYKNADDQGSVFRQILSNLNKLRIVRQTVASLQQSLPLQQNEHQMSLGLINPNAKDIQDIESDNLDQALVKPTFNYKGQRVTKKPVTQQTMNRAYGQTAKQVRPAPALNPVRATIQYFNRKTDQYELRTGMFNNEADARQAAQRVAGHITSIEPVMREDVKTVPGPHGAIDVDRSQPGRTVVRRQSNTYQTAGWGNPPTNRVVGPADAQLDQIAQQADIEEGIHSTVYHNGDQVELAPQYADKPGEVYTVSQSDQERGRCWIGDADGRGWYATFDQLIPAETMGDDDYDSGEMEEGIPSKLPNIPPENTLEYDRFIRRGGVDQKTPYDLGGADAYYGRQNNPAEEYGFQKGSPECDEYIQGYRNTHGNQDMRKDYGSGRPGPVTPRRITKTPKGVTEDGEGTPEGLPHLTQELLTHIVQQVGTEGAHAIVKSLEWGDGAAEELLTLILRDLKQDISDEEIAECIASMQPQGVAESEFTISDDPSAHIKILFLKTINGNEYRLVKQGDVYKIYVNRSTKNKKVFSSFDLAKKALQQLLLNAVHTGEQGVAEMDKSQRPPSRHGDYPLGAKGTTVKPTTPKKVVKDLTKVLDKAFDTKEVKEDTGSWIIYDPETKQIKKRFKTHTAGKSYANTHGLGFASSEYYFDNIKEKEVAENDDWDDGDWNDIPDTHAVVKANQPSPYPEQVLRAIERNPAMRADIIADYKRKQGVAESTNYWTKLQNERNTKLNSLVNELKEITK